MTSVRFRAPAMTKKGAIGRLRLPDSTLATQARQRGRRPRLDAYLAVCAFRAAWAAAKRATGTRNGEQLT